MTSQPFVLAVPSKGRLQENANRFFARAGLNVVQGRGARDYRGTLAEMPNVEVAFLSASEIVQQLAAGTAHMGVTGEDLVRETIADADARVELLTPLGFGHANVIVAVPQAWIDVRTMADLEDVASAYRARRGERMRVATKYVNLTRRFFARNRLAAFLDAALDGYGENRNRPDMADTSRLSPHLHFGEIGPRQVWRAVETFVEAHPDLRGEADKFLSEIGWREFSAHLLFHTPDLPERNWKPQFDAFPWREDAEGLAAWRRGLTGYPIVDAGMRELWTTGWMHNRVRMITASFLIKDLMIHWRHGEDWFWDTLVDADLAANAASWQWVAGSGADAAPFFRIFNPVTQGETYDPRGAYVRRWVPELAALPDAFIHKPWLAPPLTLADAGLVLGRDYPRPVVDHGEARKAALAAYKAVSGRSETDD